jgi:hypothetical protein
MSETTETTTAERPRERRRRGLLFPLILIAIGALFFAANFHFIPPVSVRALVQLWPLLLVIGGIEMILARRDPFLALAIEVVVIAVAVGLVVTQPRGIFVPVGGGSTSATVARGSSTALSLRVDGGAGTYTIAGGASALVEARSEGGELRVREDRHDGTADVRIDPTGFPEGNMVLFGGAPPVTVDVRVASDVPVSLRVTGGAGDFTIDMRDLQVRDARLEIGAAKVEVMLPKPSGDVPIRIQSGAASISITVPPEVEARITTTGGLLTTATENARFGSGTSASVARSGGATETAGYAAAKDRLTITIEAGASSITIR